MRESESRPVVLVISNIAWDFVWQRHQSVASLFADDAKIIFCEVLGTRRITWRDFGRIFERLTTLKNAPAAVVGVPPNLRIERPTLLPATNVIFNGINRWLLHRWASRQAEFIRKIDLIWNYSASRSALWLIEHVRHTRLVYDCTDDWLAVRGIPSFLPSDERAILTKADLTLVPSRALLERKKEFARRIERVPHGAWVDRFFVPRRPAGPDGSVTLLYYGHLHRQHLNFSAIEAIARERPTWRLVLVGPIKTPHSFPSNVGVVGQRSHAELREFVMAADVLIMPYVLNRYTEAVLPAKIYECLATGRPIVATPLPELVADFSRDLSFASEEREWVSAIETAIAKDSEDAAESRIARAQRNSWATRYGEIREMLAGLSL